VRISASGMPSQAFPMIGGGTHPLWVPMCGAHGDSTTWDGKGAVPEHLATQWRTITSVSASPTAVKHPDGSWVEWTLECGESVTMVGDVSLVTSKYLHQVLGARNAPGASVRFITTHRKGGGAKDED
jgi:hypothetical protein